MLASLRLAAATTGCGNSQGPFAKEAKGDSPLVAATDTCYEVEHEGHALYDVLCMHAVCVCVCDCIFSCYSNSVPEGPSVVRDRHPYNTGSSRRALFRIAQADCAVVQCFGSCSSLAFQGKLTVRPMSNSHATLPGGPPSPRTKST